MTPLTHRSPVPIDRCNLVKAIDIVGDRWTLLILRSALFGLRRFDDFQRELSVPRTVLSGRLKALTEAGLLDKQSYKVEGRRPRPEYILTPQGEALQPILMALMQWGDAWLGDGPAPMNLTQKTSRGPVELGFVDETGRAVGADNVRIAIKR
ncbi:MAG: helix-turn-helix domain-containing protein [Pseudomonadota bacterium]